MATGIKKRVFKGKCHNCQERGHYARDCPKRNADSANRKESKGSARGAEKDDGDFITEDEALFTSDLLHYWMDY
jgi:hypothetical protein